MRWVAIAAAVVLVPGCFYVDPINQRPSAQIERVTTDPPMRGGSTTVSAQWSDPDGDDVSFAWSATACAADGVTCDPAFLTGTDTVFPISDIPDTVVGGAPVAKLSITVAVTDSHGAEARPVPLLLLDVIDAAPTVEFQWSGHEWNGQFPVGLPITVLAQKSDPDDSLADVALAWDEPYAPSPTPHHVPWKVLPADPMHPDQEKRQFTPDAGDVSWTVQIAASDPANQSFDRNHDIPVAADQPPCLGETDPIVTTDTIVVDQVRRFSVYTVDDDIDPYPGPPPIPEMGTSSFAWSLASPATGGALVPLTTDDSGVVIDPADYAPGDQLDLRVDVADRTARLSPCDPSTPQCSQTGVTACLQRQTWHVEIR